MKVKMLKALDCCFKKLEDMKLFYFYFIEFYFILIPLDRVTPRDKW